MKKRTKLLMGSMIAIAGSLAFANPAKANDISATNSTTGAESDNSASVNISSQKRVDINNTAFVCNAVNITANTGENSASKNTGDGSVRSGDASATTSIKTSANMVKLDMASGSESSSISVGNSTTGAESENTAEAKINRSTNVDIDNKAKIVNKYDAKIETGENESNKNTGDGYVSSGDATILSDVVTTANEAVISGDMTQGDITINARNYKTGYESDNDAKINLTRENKVKVDNDLDVVNSIEIKANTGENESSENTGDGSVYSGDVNVDGSLLTSGNKVGLADLSSSGDISGTASNETTGADSSNDAKLVLEDGTVLKINNDTDVHNGVKIESETGENEASENTGDGEAISGDTDVNYDIETSGNIVDSGSGTFMDDFSSEMNKAFQKTVSGEGNIDISVNGDEIK